MFYSCTNKHAHTHGRAKERERERRWTPASTALLILHCLLHKVGTKEIGTSLEALDFPLSKFIDKLSHNWRWWTQWRNPSVCVYVSCFYSCASSISHSPTYVKSKRQDISSYFTLKENKLCFSLDTYIHTTHTHTRADRIYKTISVWTLRRLTFTQTTSTKVKNFQGRHQWHFKDNQILCVGKTQRNVLIPKEHVLSSEKVHRPRYKLTWDSSDLTFKVSKVFKYSDKDSATWCFYENHC